VLNFLEQRSAGNIPGLNAKNEALAYPNNGEVLRPVERDAQRIMGSMGVDILRNKTTKFKKPKDV